MSKTTILYRLVAALLLLPAFTPLLAAEQVAYLLSDESLFRFDLESEVSELVGAVGPPVSAIAGGPQGTLFAADSANDRLLVLDRDTGAAAVIGHFGQDLEVIDLAFDGAGRLWAKSCPYLFPDCLPNLIEISPDTGAVMAIGPEIVLPYISGLAVVDGTFYVAATGLRLAAVDPASGTLSSLGTGIEPCTSVRGLSGGPDGSIWVFAGDPCGSAPLGSWSLIQVDADDGAIIDRVMDGGNTSFPPFGVGGVAILPVEATQPVIDLEQPAYADRSFTIDVTYQQEWCFVGAETTVEDGRIDILAQEACGCLGSPSPTTFQTEVGPLPIGPYEISLSRLGIGVEGEPCEPVESVAAAYVEVLTETSIARIETLPAEPTVADDISLEINTSCVVEITLESVVDRIIWLRAAMESGLCFPGVSRTIVPLGLLPGGEYTVMVRETEQNGGGFEGLSRFEVRDLGSQTIDLAGRFRVEATWTRSDGSTGVARGRLISDSDLGAELWFFRPSNPELLVKLLDGCGNNGHRWFFAGGLTNLGVDITVTDRVTDEEVTYRNPLGERFEPIQDTHAFVCE